MSRTPLHRALYFLRWQLGAVLVALPAHVAFVARGLVGRRAGVGTRVALAARAIWIHLRVECGHNPAELLHVMESVIELSPAQPGVVIECGAFLGGSSAKLGHAAAFAGRELVVCDSFEGLPDVADSDHWEKKKDFEKGEYQGRLDLVTTTVKRFGRIDRTRFVKGWFDQSLPQLSATPIAAAFWDVDLQESFRSCIRALWGALAPGTRVFLHDIDREPVVAVFTDAEWWKRELGIEPPALVGARTGLGLTSPLIGYAVKG